MLLSAHFFVFYFGIIADITPPVALAAFAASGISGGDPIKTGVEASKLAIAAFIIPYMIVFSPSLLMIDTTVLEIIWVTFTAMIGYDCDWSRNNWILVSKSNMDRTHYLQLEQDLLLIYPESLSDIVGLVYLCNFVCDSVINT